jgi:tRNA pseudouridine55 synthase
MELRVTCSKGTFIRTLAMDIGELLTGGAYVEKLVRVKVGDYEL